jgi:hypothetical protein
MRLTSTEAKESAARAVYKKGLNICPAQKYNAPYIGSFIDNPEARYRGHLLH